MKKFVLLLFALVTMELTSVWAYDFSAVAPSGQTLYFNIISTIDQTCGVVRNSSDQPTGHLEIPSVVEYEGEPYTVIALLCVSNYGSFEDASGLTSVTIPNSVTSIGDYAFSGCSGLTSVTIPNSVTTIGGSAFSRCRGLTSVTIPNSVTTIEDAAFSGCSGLTSVTIGNSVTSIGDYAFAACSGLTSVTIPNSVTTIGNDAFEICSGLTSVTIGNSVTSIGNDAFRICRGLTSVTIPNSVTSIGSSAFYDCSGLTSVTIPNSVTTIEYSTFSNCSGLTSVTIPNSVTSIGDRAFSRCNGLTSVTIPNSVTSIGYRAFSGCSGLTEIISEARTAPQLSESAFEDVNSRIPVNIPCGSLASYEAGWSYFSNLIEDGAPSFDATSIVSTMGYVTVINQPTCANLFAEVSAVANPGYQFAHWSNGATQNPYSLTLTKDTVLTAYFAIVIRDTMITHDTTIVVDSIPYEVFVHDTTIVNNYIHDTTFVDRWQYDTTYVDVYVPVHDTTIVNNYIHDTTIVNNYIHDTTYVERWQYDTTYVDVYVPVHDTTIVNNYIHDTTFVDRWQYDTTYIDVYVPVHDTTIINNYIHDTTIVDYYIYDTTYVDRWQYDTTYVDVYIHDTTFVEVLVHDTLTITEELNWYVLNVVSGDAARGLVAGNGHFPEGTEVEIAAIPIEGSRFVEWQDGNTENPRRVSLLSDMSFIATFDVADVGVTDVEMAKHTISSQRGQIIVENAAGDRIRIFDEVGRCISTTNSMENTRIFNMPASGVYMVQVGSHPAEKVVVIR